MREDDKVGTPLGFINRVISVCGLRDMETLSQIMKSIYGVLVGNADRWWFFLVLSTSVFLPSGLVLSSASSGIRLSFLQKEAGDDGSSSPFSGAGDC